jgi:hypothetical protein
MTDLTKSWIFIIRDLFWSQYPRKGANTAFCPVHNSLALQQKIQPSGGIVLQTCLAGLAGRVMI